MVEEGGPALSAFVADCNFDRSWRAPTGSRLQAKVLGAPSGIQIVRCQRCQVELLLHFNLNPKFWPKVLHRDDGKYPVPRPHQELVVNMMLAVDDFTASNGATVVVPGSHLARTDGWAAAAAGPTALDRWAAGRERKGHTAVLENRNGVGSTTPVNPTQMAVPPPIDSQAKPIASRGPACLPRLRPRSRWRRRR